MKFGPEEIVDELTLFTVRIIGLILENDIIIPSPFDRETFGA